jgi:hypothetical protein
MFPHGRSYQIDYFCGWRYIFSPSFRKRVHKKWNGNTFTRLACIFGGFFGVIFTTGLILLALMAGWDLLTSG